MNVTSLRIEFHVEEIPHNEGEPIHWRATEASNFVVWGYGSTYWEAIADLCETLNDSEGQPAAPQPRLPGMEAQS